MLTAEPENDLPQAGAGAPDGAPARPSGRVRTCVGCGERFDHTEAPHTEAPHTEAPAVRLVLAPGDSEVAVCEVAVDAAGGAFGRGAHLHPRPACIEKAAKRGLARAFRGVIRIGDAPATPRALADAIEEAYARRTAGLLASARRARAVVVGADVVVQALRAGEARLVVVASDALAAAQLYEVQAAVKEGRAVVWGDKESLGRLAGSGDRAVAVMAITDIRLAAAVAMAIQVRESCRAVVDAVAPKAQGKSSRMPDDSSRNRRERPAVERRE